MLWCCPRESGCGKPPAGNGGGAPWDSEPAAVRVVGRPYRRDTETCNGYGAVPPPRRGAGRVMGDAPGGQWAPLQAWGIAMPPGKGAAVSNFEKTSSNALMTRKNVPLAASRLFLCGISCTDGLSLEKKRGQAKTWPRKWSW